MNDMIFSEKQQEIVNFTEGPLLVTASAGSGKTTVLTERIGNLVKKTRKQILAITFTNKACEEIKNKLKDFSLLENVNATTFHGFCTQILESHVGEMNWETMPQIFREEDIKQVLISSIEESPWMFQYYKTLDNKERISFVNNTINTISKIKREVILDNELKNRIQDEKIIEIYRLYNEYMSNLHAIDFDDLLLMSYQLLLLNPKIAALYRIQYAYICVDEAQDMNKAQYQLLKVLTGSNYRNIMLVGDPKQSIYAFNGSSSKYMMENFEKDYAPVYKIELFENYRSARSINKIASLVMPEIQSEEYVKLEGVYCEESYDTPEEESNAVINKIKNLMSAEKVQDIDGKLNYSDFAILARNKFVLSCIEKYLQLNKIPFFYKNTTGQINFT